MTSSDVKSFLLFLLFIICLIGFIFAIVNYRDYPSHLHLDKQKTDLNDERSSETDGSVEISIDTENIFVPEVDIPDTQLVSPKTDAH